MKKGLSLKKALYVAMLCAAAVVLHIAEGALLAPVPVPGVKLGLSNGVTLLALYLYGRREAAAVAAGRVLLGSLLSGRLMTAAFFMSASGAVAATAAMFCAKALFKKAGPAGVSIVGAVFHNAGQLGAAALLMGSSSVFLFFPVLLASAAVTGMLTGAAVSSVLKPVSALVKRK